MSDPFIGEVRMVAYGYAPKGWAECRGQRMEIAQSGALYSLLGSQFGGDDRSYFNLPDFQGRAPVHPVYGQEVIGQGHFGGSEWATITEASLAAHRHDFIASSESADMIVAKDGDEMFAQGELPMYTDYDTDTQVELHPSAITASGGGQAHYNIQPSLVIKFTIALAGTYPSRD